ncbi:EmrA/EmrK family multidrug efflux transporter periplasmic adaptor subunit [Hafnia alvei]|uniref:EmrA/EmrK family multidrug efflux transporter periplasmic adaptor subunit n=1 Tax=Hafnia alvei TaxID=569 RepID=UPI000B74BE27|nr:EmrA/EmrK family multidrug efflux transporter periplasmic adaptor subunit [Hafnia alvei]MBI0275190.1 EmrA/EmrK family multidrug efflux transporter periplasmic adaptor subunit [Hafnia alvei]PNK98800.1 multidrug export protein EmrA [Hafnia alvei]
MSLSKLSKDKINFTRNKLILSVFIIFLLCVSVFSVYWFLELRELQTTDDAYVSGNKILISSQVASSVVSINYTNTDLVKKGDVLVQLDSTDATLAYNKAKSNLSETVRKVRQLYINNSLDRDNIEKTRIAYEQSLTDLNRYSRLTGVAAVPHETLQHAKNLVASNKISLNIALQEYKSNQALLRDTNFANQPSIQNAADAVREAWLTLQRTKIKSPVTGYVAQRNVNVGENISVGQSLMAIVPVDQFWINANFKETQLGGVRIGQKASFTTDIYGDSVVYTGYVTGINMGTGSAFSLLPAQNASGNWIKVVQRVPVKIMVDVDQLENHPLRIGLSTNVKIKTIGGEASSLPKTQRAIPVYSSKTLVLDTADVDREIVEIINTN